MMKEHDIEWAIEMAILYQPQSGLSLDTSHAKNWQERLDCRTNRIGSIALGFIALKERMLSDEPE